ncbi:torsin-1A-like [Babylonia areolata]|uniref:torsin-1A-like n=1 Tax=Babylonia areolata TaxID=304850 RepID=UPI003FD05FE2
MPVKNVLLFVVILGSIQIVENVEPLSGVYALGAAITALGMASYNIVMCQFYECCDKKWITNNATALYTELDGRLYGQHLVKQVVTSHVKGHVRTRSPVKALVLSFHGPTGTGKNHVSRIVAEALYKKGLRSQNVRLMSATKEFPHQEMVPLYKDRLRDIVEKQVKKCPQSLFIFDEIDKLPGGLIDTIKPYLDYHEQLGGVDYRHAIFIFLSNAGGESITKHVLEQWREGKKREDIGLAEMENILARAAINSESEGGLWHSELISKHLVTAFIPYLPLERRHVRECVRDTLVQRQHYKSRGQVPDDVVRKVMAELTFYPEKEQLFSVTGCKRVAEKVDYVMLV